MASQHLTDATIKRLPVPDRGSRKTYDADVPGFGICVTANSVRSFILRYRTRTGRERCVTMGQFPNWSTVGARQEARRLKQEIDRGFDPLADIEDARAAPTIADLLDRFDAEHVAKKRPRTADEYRRIAAHTRQTALWQTHQGRRCPVRRYSGSASVCDRERRPLCRQQNGGHAEQGVCPRYQVAIALRITPARALRKILNTNENAISSPKSWSALW